MKAWSVPTIFTAIDKISPKVEKMQKSVTTFADRAEKSFQKVGDASKKIAKISFLVGASILAPLAMAGNEAIKFEDRMADVSKTTGLAGKELSDFGKDILGLSTGTRTSIEELQEIAAIGGSMGVAKAELLGFTDSINMFNVALGTDFGGVESASRAISGLKTLFKETREIDVATAITKTGSAINALGSKGVNVPQVTEFLSRVGQLPDAIKPSIQNAAALGATLDKAGISAEIGSRAFGDILLTAAQNLPKFAKQMNISERAASELINTNPTAFAVEFAESLKGLNAQQISNTLKALKLTDAGAIKVVGALSSSTEMLASFQKISNEEFAKGTSLLDEYNTKNETNAAKLQKAKNNLQAIAIVIGTELLPVASVLISKASGILTGIIAWTKANPGLTKTIVIATAAIAGLSFVISGIFGAVGLAVKAFTIYQWAWATVQAVNLALQGKTMLFLQENKVAMAAYKVITAAVTAVTWLWNAALVAVSSPITWIILAITAIISIIAVVISKVEGWGAQWDSIVAFMGHSIDAFQFSVKTIWLGLEHGFLNMVDAIVLAWKWAQNKMGFLSDEQYAKDKARIEEEKKARVAAIRENAIKAIDSAVKADNALEWKLKWKSDDEEQQAESGGRGLINPEATKQDAMIQRMETTQKQNVAIDIRDQTGRASVDPGNNMIPVKLSTTMGF